MAKGDAAGGEDWCFGVGRKGGLGRCHGMGRNVGGGGDRGGCGGGAEVARRRGR